MPLRKEDWKNEFAKAWGAKKLSELDKTTQLSVMWIDVNVVKPEAEKANELVEALEEINVMIEDSSINDNSEVLFIRIQKTATQAISNYKK